MASYASPVAPAAPPARRSAASLYLGLVCLLLGLLEALWAAYCGVRFLVAEAFDQVQSHLLPGNVPHGLASAVAHFSAKMLSLSGWEAVSVLPLGVMAVMLCVVAIPLMLSRARWLAVARGWCGVTLIAWGVAVAVQLVRIVPELQRIEAWARAHISPDTSVVLWSMLPMIVNDLLVLLWLPALTLTALYLERARRGPGAASFAPPRS